MLGLTFRGLQGFSLLRKAFQLIGNPASEPRHKAGKGLITPTEAWHWGSFKRWFLKFIKLNRNMTPNACQIRCLEKPWRSTCTHFLTRDTVWDNWLSNGLALSSMASSSTPNKTLRYYSSVKFYEARFQNTTDSAHSNSRSRFQYVWDMH